LPNAQSGGPFQCDQDVHCIDARAATGGCESKSVSAATPAKNSILKPFGNPRSGLRSVARTCQTPPCGRTIPNPKPLSCSASCSASMHLPHDTACFAPLRPSYIPKRAFKEREDTLCTKICLAKVPEAKCEGTLPVISSVGPVITKGSLSYLSPPCFSRIW